MNEVAIKFEWLEEEDERGRSFKRPEIQSVQLNGVELRKWDTSLDQALWETLEGQ